MAKQGLARLIQQLTTEDWLSRVVDEVQERGGRERYDEPDLTIHPSGSGSVCARDIQLGMLGYHDATPPRNRRRMDNGTAVHDRWNQYLKDVGVLVKANVRVKQRDPLWSGELDVIVERPDTGTHHLVEIKSMNSRRFRKLPRQVPDRVKMLELLYQVERGYMFQMAQYYSVHGPKYGLDRECIFLAEDTDSQEFKCLYLAFTDAFIREAFRLPQEAQTASLEGELIEPPFSRKSPQCKGCYHRKLCFDLQDGEEGVTLWATTVLDRLSRSGH